MRLTEGDILYLGDLTFYILVNLWTVYVGGGCIDRKFMIMFRPQKMSSGKGVFGMSFFIPSLSILNKIRRVLVCVDRLITAMG